MTQWVEDHRSGRDRGPRGLLRAWLAVQLQPRSFFRSGVATGDQAPGLTFAVAVATVAVGGRLLVAPATVGVYGRVVAATGSSVLTAVIVVAAVAVLFAPLVLHLAAAVATLLLAAIVEDRGGVGETVQVIAYAAAPAVWLVHPHPAVAVLAASWATALLAVGMATVHGTAPPRAAVASIPPAVVAYWLPFGAVAGLRTLLG